MARTLYLLLAVAIFIAAAVFVLQLIPQPYHLWATVILVVVGAALAIQWLVGGGFGRFSGPPSA